MSLRELWDLSEVVEGIEISAGYEMASSEYSTEFYMEIMDESGQRDCGGLR